MSNEYYNLGSYSRTVTTDSSAAQFWFNRGLIWAYSFNHEEALRCFQKAIDLDSSSAMAYWGIAYARGPNYNKSWNLFDSLDLKAAFEDAKTALERARDLAPRVTQVEAALIEAMVARFPNPEVPEDLGALNIAYADSMRVVYNQFPDDLDVSALFVDALMCISPRALWDLKTGNPAASHTTEARIVIEKALALPGGHEHPALNHLYIHLMEMSPYPEVALPVADRLRKLVPEGSHMLHMPTHIDAACGDWRRVVDSNHDAMVADDHYFSREEGSILYTMYRAHYILAKIYGALMSARYEDALSSVKRYEGILTPKLLFITSPPMADWTESFLGTVAHVYIRFGRWDEILKLEIPVNQQLYCSTTAMIYYARGTALAVLGRTDEAKLEQTKFETARATVPRSRLNSVPVLEIDVLKVASAMLQGEIQYRCGEFKSAFASLREATALEDSLPYSDPPAWLQPSRHALGALLLEQGHTHEAELVYREDLGLGGNIPRRKARLNNVWGLHGLYESLTRNGKHDEARMIRLQRDIALGSADTPLKSSCFCRLST